MRGRRDQKFYLTFSVSRLTRLLRDAGFVVSPPSGYEGSQVRFVSHPTKREIGLEFSYTGEEWQSGKPIETVETSTAYL